MTEIVVDTVTVIETVEVSGPTAEIVEASLQGPPGPRGEQGPSGSAFTLPAGETLSGHRVLALIADAVAVYADQGDTSAQMIQGFSAHAATAGEEVEVVQSGPLAWPAANLTPGAPVFLAHDGLVTQTAPTTGWLVQVGTAVESDLLSVAIGPAYFLGA